MITILAQIVLFIIFSLQSRICRDLVYDPHPISSVSLSELNNLNVYISALSQDQKYAFVTALEGGIFIVSLEDMLHPKVISNIPAIGAQYVQEQNRILFVADVQEGLIIYDIFDLQQPKLISKWQDYKHIQSVIVTKDKQYAFLLGNGMVFCLNITDLTKPTTVSSNGIPSPVSYRVKLSSDETHIIISNHIKGVQIYDIRDKTQLILRANKNPAYATWDCIFTPDNTSIYVVDAYYGLSYANVQSIFQMQIGSSSQLELDFKNIYRTSEVSQSVAITADGLFVILGLRSIGLKLFQIENKKYDEVIFVQNLEGDYLSNNIVFSENDNESFVFVTNGITFLIYQQVKLNSNKDFPNFFNTFQSSSQYISNDQWPWQIICLSDNKHIIETNPTESVKIFNIENQYNPELVHEIKRDGGDFAGVATSLDLKYLYIGATQLGLAIYDISNISQPVYKTNYTPLDPQLSGNQGVGVTIDRSGQIVILSNGFYGFGVIDVKDPLNFTELGEYQNQSFPCGFEKCEITSDHTTIICACRETGLFFYDFTNNNLQLVYALQKLGAEYLILSKDEKHAFVSNGFQGLLIVNIVNKYAPYIVSQQRLDGWASSLITLFDENYIMASQIEKGQLVIINIQDLTNPFIQSKLEFPNESSNSVCVTPDQKAAYFIGKKGLRYLPIYTDLIVHTQIQVQQTDSNNEIFYVNLSKEDILLVGQKARVFFIPLYTWNNIKFQNAYYYRNFEKQSLPYWIEFYSNKRMIDITVDKLGAKNSFSNEKQGENIVILECLLNLASSSFITANINATISDQIFSTLTQQGYVDSYGYLTSKLDPAITFELDFFDEDQFTRDKVGDTKKIELIQMDIKKILTFSKIEYPIRFYVQSSLSFNYDRTLYKNKDILETPSIQLIVFIQILNNGKIVKKSYDGVIATISEDQTSLKIQGQTNFVNSIISNQIQIANKTSNLSECFIDFIISDNSNFDIQEQIPLSELSFITLYNPIYLNQQNSLQSQFNKIYSDGKLNVEQRYQFSFDMNTFRQQDNLKISYKAYLVESELIEITTGSWIEFNEFNIGFSTMKSFSSLYDSSRIRVVATDGYSEMYDEFVIKFDGVPFFYVIQLILQIIGPIIGFFGIWNYRSQIYLMVMGRFYMYSSESAIVGEVYKKQIVLMNDVLKDAHSLWKSFLKQNRQFQNEIVEEYSLKQQFDISIVMGRIYLVYQMERKKYPQIDQREFDQIDSRLVRIYKRLCYEIILKKNNNTLYALNYLIKVGTNAFNKKDWYKLFVEVSSTFEVQSNKIVQSNDEGQSESVQSSQIQLKLFNTDHIQNNESEDQKQDAKENDKFSYDLNQIIFNKDNFNTNKDETPSQKQNNHLQINELDSEKALNPQQFSSTNSKLKKQIDQIIVENKNIKPEEKDEEAKIDIFYNLNPFADITVKMDEIIKQIAISKPSLEYDKFLLEEIILLEASGIRSYIPSRVNPAQGESLYLSSHQLLRVQAFKREDENNCCYGLKRFFSANYNPIGFIQNNPLPKWLNCQIIDGIIHIWGTPQQNDEPEVLIRVIDHYTFTVLSFHIYLKDKDGNTIKNKSYKPQIKYSHKPKSNNSDQKSKDNQKDEEKQKKIEIDSKIREQRIQELCNIKQLQQLKYSKESSIMISFTKQDDHSQEVTNLDEKDNKKDVCEVRITDYIKR